MLGNQDFDWSVYTDGYNGGNKLIPNNRINGVNKHIKCFSREIYAQQLMDIYNNQSVTFVKKDLNTGDNVRIVNISNINTENNTIDIELEGGLTVTIDLLREKRFIQLFGSRTLEEFCELIKDKDAAKTFLLNDIKAYVSESFPTLKVSLWQGHINGLKEEFMRQISEPTMAYTAKILSTNRGGFFVEVQGVEAFMPGSLAAPNKITDFYSYVGREVMVMIEDFLPEINSFIVSHKKFLQHITPIKIKELDVTAKFNGVVTGCSKYGIFVEFNEYFTGLLHTSKMNDEIKRQFSNGNIKADDVIEFYIDEITKDNKIILTSESPNEKLEKLNAFILNSKDKILTSRIQAITSFGIIVGVENVSGVIPIKNVPKKLLSTYKQGDNLNVVLKECINDNLIFNLPKIH